MQTFSDRLNYLLESTGKKKTELAKLLSVSDAAIWKLCNGKSNPSKQTITMISERFGVNENWLLTGEGEMQAPKSKEAELAEITAQLFKKSQTDEQTYNFIMQLSEILLDMNEAQMQLVFDAIRKLNAAISEPEEKKE